MGQWLRRLDGLGVKAAHFCIALVQSGAGCRRHSSRMPSRRPLAAYGLPLLLASGAPGLLLASCSWACPSVGGASFIPPPPAATPGHSLLDRLTCSYETCHTSMTSAMAPAATSTASTCLSRLAPLRG
mgnify:CR=1 FL=1